MENFYTEYEEEHDFWYYYWVAFIRYREWEYASNYLFDENNTDTAVSQKVKNARSKLKNALNNMNSWAKDDNKKEDAKEILSLVEDGDNTIEFVLAEHKLWNEIKQICKPDVIVNGSKLKDYEQALAKVEDFYNEGFWQNEGKARVYGYLLNNACSNEAFRKEISAEYSNLKTTILQIIKSMYDTCDDDTMKHARKAEAQISASLKILD